MKEWIAAGASVTGASHILRGRSNDDAFAIRQRGDWTAIVVSDGAGSCARAKEGSHFISEAIVVKLLSIATRLDELGPGPWLNDAVIEAVLHVRSELASFAGSYDLKDFHCTLVAALLSSNGGFTVHIGDGAILVGRAIGEDQIEMEVHSRPENGEYANETYFITESTWLKNIRIKPLRDFIWIALTTDGAASVLMESEIKSEATNALFGLLSLHSPTLSVSGLLGEFLECDYARSCSNDDKTLAIAFKGSSTPLLFSDFPTAPSNFRNELVGIGDQLTVLESEFSVLDEAKIKSMRLEKTKADRSSSKKKLVIGRALFAFLTLSILVSCVAFIFRDSDQKINHAGESIDLTETDILLDGPR